MNTPVSLKRRLTHAVMRCVGQGLPASRKDWAKAMRAELDHLDNDRDALAWSMGCLVTASKERIVAMITGNLKVSRWILVPEMLLCFVPLTFGWLDAIGGSSGVLRMNGDVIQKRYLHAPGGTLVLAALVAGALLGLLGPLGLTATFRLVVSGHAPRYQWLRTALVAGPIAYGVLTLAIRMALGGTGALGFGAADSFDFWSGILLLSALPALGAAHLLRLAPQSARQSLAAA
jgi:hypothetical protein